MLAEEVKPEDTLPGASIYVSRSSRTGRYSPRGRRSQTGYISHGLPYMLAEAVKPEYTLPWVFHLDFSLAEEVKPEDTPPGASIYVSPVASIYGIYVSRRSQTGRYSPRGFHIC